MRNVLRDIPKPILKRLSIALVMFPPIAAFTQFDGHHRVKHSVSAQVLPHTASVAQTQRSAQQGHFSLDPLVLDQRCTGTESPAF